ncbi:MAG: hypothetical protein AB7O45_10205 [Alphaproteobacteria bacterium]
MTTSPETAAAAPPPAEEPPAEEYAIVEIFGHRRHVGRIAEVERFGAKMLRVDVPTDGDFEKGFVSHFYGGSSIFGLVLTDLDTVRRSNQPSRSAGHYRLPAPDPDADPDGGDRGDDGDDEVGF